jgi:hypothetical protein
MAQTPSSDIAAAKSSTDDKASIDVAATEALDSTSNDLVESSAMLLAPLPDEPIVTRKELWSYYSMFEIDCTKLSGADRDT